MNIKLLVIKSDFCFDIYVYKFWIVYNICVYVQKKYVKINMINKLGNNMCGYDEMN